MEIKEIIKTYIIDDDLVVDVVQHNGSKSISVRNGTTQEKFNAIKAELKKRCLI